jgi:uncharacterized protein (DUF342 family)
VVLEGAEPKVWTALALDDVLGALKQARIEITDAVHSRAEELTATLRRAAETAPGSGSAPLPARFLIAEGHAPVEAEHGRLEWSPELSQVLTRPAAQADRIDHYAVHGIVTVPAGAVIGRILPPKDGAPGRDVHGKQRAPRVPRGMPLQPGTGVTLGGAGGDEVVAAAAGRVVVEAGKIRVVDVLEISGDVDFATGSVQACVDVHVRGTVRSKFSVRTTHSLHVDRAIEAADVEVGQDIVVRGGIFGQERSGRVRAGGNVTARLLGEVDLEVVGDVQFEKEILNSRVRVQGRLQGPRGTIIGGEVYAREGVEARVVGSERCVTTCIAAGTEVNVSRHLRRQERYIKQLQTSADQIRQTVNPLLANKKRLLPAQREKAAELLCKADEIELQIEELRQQNENLLKQPAPKGAPCIQIGEAIYPGVRITLDARETRVQSLLHGPVKIELRKVKDVTEIVAVNPRTGSVTVLPSMEVDLDLPPTDQPARKGKKDETEPRVVDRRTA